MKEQPCVFCEDGVCISQYSKGIKCNGRDIPDNCSYLLVENEQNKRTKETKLKEDILLMKIVGILADYKFNSTETAEMVTRRIMGIINTQAKQEVLGEVMKIIDRLDKGESWISKEELRQKLKELK